MTLPDKIQKILKFFGGETFDEEDLHVLKAKNYNLTTLLLMVAEWDEESIDKIGLNDGTKEALKRWIFNLETLNKQLVDAGVPESDVSGLRDSIKANIHKRQEREKDTTVLTTISSSPPRTKSLFGKDTVISPVHHFKKPEASDDFSCFYQELYELEEDNGFLTFSELNRHVINNIKSLLIRKSYERLYELIMELILPQNQWSRNQRIHLTGTPGIGKTTFIIYMMWRLTRHPAKPSFVYSSPRTTGTYYLCNGRQVEISDHPPSGHQIIRLVDGHENLGALKYTPGPVILITSPRSTNYNEFKKLEPEKLYLSIWSIEELSKCAKKNNFDLDKVQSLYNHYGGIPRSVFSSKSKDMQVQLLQDQIGRFNLTKLKEFAGETHESDNLSGVLLHILADDEFRIVRVIMGSTFITDQMISKTMMEDYRSLLHDLLTKRSFADPSGFIFELFAHKKLIQEESYRVRCLRNKNEITRLNLNKRRFNCFRVIPNSIVPDLYYIPSIACFPTLDSFEYPNRIYNITMNSSHNINITEEFMIVANMMFALSERIDFFFFVPPKVFESEFKCEIKFAAEKKHKEPLEVYNQRVKKLENFKSFFSNRVDIHLMECDLESYIINSDWKPGQITHL